MYNEFLNEIAIIGILRAALPMSEGTASEFMMALKHDGVRSKLFNFMHYEVTMSLILSIDQGTTSTRSIVFDSNGTMKGVSQVEHKQIFPQPAWVEHDPLEIRDNVFRTMKEALDVAKADWKDISAIGITNQRETIVAWNPKTGIPYYNAIVWQCRRSAGVIDELRNNGYADLFHQRTGLVLDAYFSGSKIRWLVENNTKIATAQNTREVVFGTIDAWIVYNLTGELKTDVSNASRTLLMNLRTGDWDQELAEILKVNVESLPRIVSSALGEGFGEYVVDGEKIPVSGIAGDQQAALFGQSSFNKGENKCTYGTGNFALMNTGTDIIYSRNGLLTTVAWKLGKDPVVYALEGSVFITGAAVQWLRDGMEIIKDSAEIEQLARSVESSDGVVVVPAFAGLGAPYWDQNARGLIIGITRATSKRHIARAILEGIAHQTADLYDVLKMDSNLSFEEVRVDGGATRNDLLMQMQADLLNAKIVRPRNIETTALGAAYLAGLSVDVWSSEEELKHLNAADKTFNPSISPEQRKNMRILWKKAVKRATNWVER